MIKFFHYEHEGEHYWVPEINGQRMRALKGDNGENPPSDVPDFGEDASPDDILANPHLAAPREFIASGGERVLEISPLGAPSACVAVGADEDWLLPVCHGSGTQTAAEEAAAVLRLAEPGDAVAEFKEAWEFGASPSPL